MDYEKEGLLHGMFVRQADGTPDKIAVVEAGGRQLTFRDLNSDSDILAKTLKRKGVKTDSCVGIYLNKSIEFTVSYIAILKAGKNHNIHTHSNIDIWDKAFFEAQGGSVVDSIKRTYTALPESYR
jgi:non-ribosomal peptide synthetase component F